MSSIEVTEEVDKTVVSGKLVVDDTTHLWD